jgi:WD40 repeat protein
LWDLRTRKPLGRSLGRSTGLDSFTGVRSVAFSPDGRTLASSTPENTIRLWDVRTHKQLGAPLTGHSSSIYSVAFSPDGRKLVSSSDDKTIRLWDARTHKSIGESVEGHNGAVGSVAFSSEGRTLISAGFDKTIRLWTGLLWDSFNELQTQVCDLVGTGLSKTEWAQYAAGIPLPPKLPVRARRAAGASLAGAQGPGRRGR